MINDLTFPKDSSLTWKFADDITVSEIVNKSEQSALQIDIDRISTWFRNNLFQLNSIICKEMILSFTRPPAVYQPISISNQTLERVTSIKSLGVILTDDLKWTNHVNTITSKASKRLYLLRQLKRADAGNVDLVNFYCSCMRSVLEYAC